jgi:hypothetical protein
MVAISGVRPLGAAVLLIALLIPSEASGQRMWRMSVELGTPAALRLDVQYQEPSEIFPRLEGTFVFPVLITARNISGQPLELETGDLRLGFSADRAAQLRPIAGDEAMDMLRRDTRMSDILRAIAGQTDVGRNPFSPHLFDLHLRPGQSRRGYVFFLRPAGVTFNGFMTVGTTAHLPEMVPTNAIGVSARTRSGNLSEAVTAAINKVPWLSRVRDLVHGRPFARSYALLFGISTYKTAANLPGPANDLKNMKEFLDRQGFDQVVDLKDGEVTVAALRNVQAHFENRIAADDRLLIYYAGHGQRNDTGDGYLLLSEGARVPMKDFMSWIRRVKVKHLLVLLDACYSGAAIGGQARDVLEPLNGATRQRIYSLASEGGRYVITAGDERQLAHEGEKWGGGLFTSSVLRALKSNAAKKAGLMTTHELYATVRNYVLDEVLKSGLTAQTPLIQDLGIPADGRAAPAVSKGEFVFVTAL